METMSTMSVVEESRTDALVLYSPSMLQISENVQKLAPISQLIIENRIVGVDEIYTASISKIEIYPGKAFCLSTISRFIKKTAVEQEEPKMNLLQALRKKVFKSTPTNPAAAISVITIGEVDYILDWQQPLKQKKIIDTDWGEKIPKLVAGFIGETKAELAMNKDVLLSNKLLVSLFEPIGISLITVYQDIAQF